MFIQTEETPNPNSLKFIPGFVLLKEGQGVDFPNQSTARHSPLALRLFSISGVESIFIGRDFITVTKAESSDWMTLKATLLGSMMEHLVAQKPVLSDSFFDDTINVDVGIKTSDIDDEIVKQIIELIDTKVRPSVAMDGGDIVFSKFEDGVVYLHMKGACSGCPSSTVTLKSGIENMLRYYVPEVKEVVAV